MVDEGGGALVPRAAMDIREEFGQDKSNIELLDCIDRSVYLVSKAGPSVRWPVGPSARLRLVSASS